MLLAPGSVLRYDTANFGSSTRELQLEGRAHLYVAHDPRRPFMVYTARTVTEDLGTDFVITDYAEDAASEVVVASGTVAVRVLASDSTRPATCSPAASWLQLDSPGRVEVHRGVDLRAQLAWTEGRLVFVDVPARRGSGAAQPLVRQRRAAGRLRPRHASLQRLLSSSSEATWCARWPSPSALRVERRGNIVVLVPLSDRSREN